MFIPASGEQGHSGQEKQVGASAASEARPLPLLLDRRGRRKRRHGAVGQHAEERQGDAEQRRVCALEDGFATGGRADEHRPKDLDLYRPGM